MKIKNITAKKNLLKPFSVSLLLLVSGCAFNQKAPPVCNDAAFYPINSEQTDAFDEQGNAKSYNGAWLRKDLAKTDNALKSIRNIPSRATGSN